MGWEPVVLFGVWIVMAAFTDWWMKRTKGGKR